MLYGKMTHTQIPKNYTENTYTKMMRYMQENMVKYVIHCTNWRTQMILST